MGHYFYTLKVTIIMSLFQVASYTYPCHIVLQCDLENLKADLITIYASCKYIHLKSWHKSFLDFLE